MSSVPSSSRPSSPTKPGVSLHESLKPNPHPYAIKTTSTGILSRSATTSPSVSHSQNHYVPLSPSPSPTKSTHSDYERRGSRHRYSRSLTDEIPRPLPVPPEELYYQQQHGHGHARSWAETLPTHMSDPSANPKTWTYEQLAQNVPEIADFVNEHEITGRAFLRFDEGVLNAYGVTEQWRRSLLLSASRRLRQSAFKDRFWPHGNPMASDYGEPTGGLSHSHSLSDSPTKSRFLTLDEEEDQAYLSSSSISSTSSVSGRRKRRYRPNGRVHGMVASFERSSSVDEGPRHRERSGSISSVESSDEPYIYQPQPQSTAGRPLPYPPHPRPHAGEGSGARGPLLLPTSSFPDSLSSSPYNTPHATGNGAYVTPHATGIGNGSNTTSTNGQRPLPALPTHPSLRSSPFEADHPSADHTASPDIQGDGERKNTSGEMTMDELLAVLNADAAADEKDASAASPAQQRTAYVNTDRRREKNEKRNGRTGAAAWEMDFGLGETVKRAPASAPPAQAQAQAAAVGEDELTVEELLALEGAGAGAGMGAAAWVDEPEGVGRTMKRVGEMENLASVEDLRFQSIGKGTGTGSGKGKGMDRISLSKGRMGKKQGRQVGELFTVEGGMEVAAGGVAEKGTSKETEEMELERMREVERRLLSAEEEERERWCRQEEKEREEARRRLEEEERRILQREAEARGKKEEEENRRRIRMEEEVAERRKHEERERQLASSLEETRRMLDVFRGRLEEVERRLGEMEASAAPSRPAQADTLITEAAKHEDGTGSQTCLGRRLRMLAAWALSTSLGAALPPIVGVPLTEFANGRDTSTDHRNTVNDGTSTTTNARSTSQRGDRAARIRALYPATIHRYALLIGIGMCAIMLRGFMRWGVRGVRGMGLVGARGVRGR